MKKRWLIPAFSLLLVGLAACSSTNKTSSESTKQTTTSTSKMEKVDLNSLPLPQLNKEVAADEAEVELVTSLGNIKMKLFPKLAPKAVENFLTHAKEGYYDGLTFHRVINDFMIQTGDPKGDDTGGKSIWDKDFENEISNQLYNLRGAVAMANAGPNTNGSQFYIVQNHDDVSDGLLYDDYPKDIVEAYKNGGYPSLDGGYTVFGQVIDGMDVVDKIAGVPTDSNDKPKDAVTITKINVLKDAK